MVAVSPASAQESGEEVAGDLLDAGVGAEGTGVDGGAKVSGGFTQAVAPPDGGGVEHDIVSGPGIDGGGELAAVGFARGFLSGTARHHFQSWNRRGIAVPFPSDEARDGVASLHAGVFEEPMIGFATGPVGAAGDGAGRMGADEFIRIRAFVGQGIHGDEIARAARRTEDAGPFEDAMGSAMGIAGEGDPATDGVAGEEGGIEAVADGALDVAEHFQGPVFVVTDTEESEAAPESTRIRMGVLIGDIGDVITFAFEPVGDGKFPEEEFAGTLGERGIEDLAVTGVGPVEAHLDIATPPPLMFAVVVEGELGGPPVIGLPGVVAALEQEIDGPVIAHDEDDIAFKPGSAGAEASEMNAADGVAGDGPGMGDGPLAVADPFVADGWGGMGAARKIGEGGDATGTVALIEAEAEDLEVEGFGGIGADVEIDALAGADAEFGAIAFDPGTAPAGGGIDAGGGEKPVAGAGPVVFAADGIALGGAGRGDGCGATGGECEWAEGGDLLEGAATTEGGHGGGWGSSRGGINRVCVG